jgi:protein-S-isoprenylcysteine O-methyltransferase Ste14
MIWNNIMTEIVNLIFLVNVVALFILLVSVSWSVAAPRKRLLPSPSKNSWQHKLAWILFYLVFGINALLIIFDWNTWVLDNLNRYIVGIPLILIGSLLLLWGIKTLGTKNTSGFANGFINDGPYRFTRNPKYLGDILLFIGLSIVANSLYLWISHFLLILVFVITPLAEEDWLLDQYGDSYRAYLKGTSRFL